MPTRNAWWMLGLLGVAGCYATVPDYCAPGTPERNWAGACGPVDAGSEGPWLDAPAEANGIDEASLGEGGADVADAPAEDADRAVVDVATCDGTRSPHDAACVIDEAFGVFVAPSNEGGSDTTGAGTRAAP